MQRYMPGRLPQNNGEWPGGPAQQRLSPLQAAVALGEHVRTEHGRAGVQRLVAALSPLLPGDVLLRADGQTLHSIHDLMAVRRTHLVGDTMTLTVLLDGQTFDADVPLYASED